MIISTGRRNGKTQEMLKQAMKENELLGEALKNARKEIAKLKSENKKLKEDRANFYRNMLIEVSKCKTEHEMRVASRDGKSIRLISNIFSDIRNILAVMMEESEGKE